MAWRTPRDYQRALRDFAIERPRVNWWAGTGTGKTGAGLELFAYLKYFGEVRNLLVVSTKRICTMVWPQELRKWENFQHLSIACAIGKPDERLAALRQGANITTINYPNLPWLIDKIGEDNWPWDMVIADESTMLRGMRISMETKAFGRTVDPFMKRTGDGSKRAAAIARVAHKRVRRWINMTGEPAPNGLIDNWGQMWFIDGGAALGRNFTAFQERWFRQVRVPGDNHRLLLVPTQYADAEIKERMRPYTLTIEAKDYFDLPPTVINPIKVPLSGAARRHYDEMEQSMFTEIKQFGVEAVSSGSKQMKCRQIAGGAVYVEPGQPEWVHIHDDKIDAIKDVVEELNGDSVLIAYQFKHDLERLKKAFPEGRFFDDNPKTLAAFVNGDFSPLFIHPASGAHGIDGMQLVCRNVIWFAQTWDLEWFRQLNERVGAMRQLSAGLYRTVFIHLLIAEDTVDEEMVERIETKASVNDSLKLAMKRRDRNAGLQRINSYF